MTGYGYCNRRELVFPLLVFALLLSLPSRAVSQAKTTPATDPANAKAASPGSPANPGNQDKLLQFRIRAAFDDSATSPSAGDQGRPASPGLPQPSKEPAWTETLFRNSLPATPVDVQLVGHNIVVLVQIVPFEAGPTTLRLIVQGQVWLKMPDGSISFHTTMKTLNLELGGNLLFYPLGTDPKTGTPLTIEIMVDRVPK